MRKLDVGGFVAALERARPGDGVEVLLAVGGFGVEGHDRIGLVTLEERPRVLEDAYLRSSEIDALWHAISRAREQTPARRGGWDTMHATRWSHAWSDDELPFTLVARAGRAVWVAGERLVLGRGPAVDRSEIATIEPYVGEDWVRRGVRLRLRDGTLRDVAYDDDRAPTIDPTYDGLNLLADTAWTHGLARSLQRGLGAPIVDCT